MAGTEHVISMEELLSRKVSLVREEAGETSRRRQSIEIEEEASSKSKMRKENLEKLKKAGANVKRSSAAKTTPKIQKVPALLRGHENFKNYFEPRVVSLGPIHHGKKEYQAVEDFKLGMASIFIEESGKSGEFLLEKIAVKIKQLRHYSDEKVAFAQQDLFLLQNQLPYQLLLDLMDYSGKKEKWKKSIETFMRKMVHERGQDVGKDGETNGTPIHLLDLLRTKLVGKSTAMENKGRSNGLINSFINRLANLIPCKSKKQKRQQTGAPPVVSQRAGTRSSRNMSFLESLIDNPGDVKEVRNASILYNLLGSDEEVAKLFNEIGTDLVPDLDEYKQVRTQIQEYYDKAWVTWVAEFFHNHFSSPWTLLAFLGTSLALFLSATQTWDTVFSHPGP
ncbi:hypothetical protein I3760_10G037600 [Carya illinoinensis]|nr:hypothetical protein I3760_10G037600 [Carya illinoinensis]